MVKIYRIREDGSFKECYFNTQAEADQKLKLSNYVSEAGEKEIQSEIPDLFIEDVQPEEIPDFVEEGDDNA